MSGLGDVARGRTDDPSWLRDELQTLHRRIGRVENARQPTAGGGVYPQVIRQFNGNVSLNGSATTTNAVSQAVPLPAGYTQALVWATYMLWGTHNGTGGGVAATLTGQIDISTTPAGGSATDDICPTVALDLTVANMSGTLTVSYSGLYSGLASGSSVFVAGQSLQLSNFVTSGNTAQLNGVVLFMR